MKLSVAASLLVSLFVGFSSVDHALGADDQDVASIQDDVLLRGRRRDKNNKKEDDGEDFGVIPDQYIIKLKSNVVDVDSTADELLEKAGGNKNDKKKLRVLQKFKGFSAKMNRGQLKKMERELDVDYIEPDGIVKASAVWGLDRIDQINLPLDNSYNPPASGSGVKAYIIDTGIRSTHNDFGGRVQSAYFDAFGGNGDDCNGHGTHVAGTVGGATYGVAPDVTLYSVRVLGCNGSGSYSGVIAGIQWVTQQCTNNGPCVANLSLGGGPSTSVDNAIQAAVAAGVTVVVAAGNSNANACNYSPARAVDAITVGSTTSSDTRSSFSNIGSCVDIFAPGSSITSAWYTSNSATTTISGTSMASPHVAGVAAIVLEQNPTFSPDDVDTFITNAATPGKVGNAGSGSPNLLLYSPPAGSPPPPPPPPPTPSPTSGGGGGFCFSLHSTVIVKGKGKLPISELRLEDYVQSDAKGKFSKVYAFGNRELSSPTPFVSVTTQSSQMELTPDHMVYLADRSLPVPAKSVRVDDVLRGVEGEERVLHVDDISRDGYITPLTVDGTIVIDGIVASCYAGKTGSGYYLGEDDGPAETDLLHYQSISHVAVAPLRFMCTRVSSMFCSEKLHHSEESVQHAGKHRYIAVVHSLKHYVKSGECGVVLHLLLFLIVIGVGLAFYVLESAFGVGALLALMALAHWAKMKKKEKHIVVAPKQKDL